MSHKAHVVHHVRGRIRLRLPEGVRNRALLQRVKESVAPLHGVKNTEINPATGSIVVHYDSGIHSEFEHKLANHGVESELFRLQVPELTEVDEIADKIEREAEFLAANSETARTVVDWFKRADLEIKRATDNAVDLKVLLPLGLAVYSLVEIGLEASTPLWVTLGIFSFNSFVSLHAHPHGTSVNTNTVVTQAPESCPEPPAPAKPESKRARRKS